MDSRKLIPLALTFVLIVCAVILYLNGNKKNDTYKKLNIEYNNQNYTYKELIIDNKISFAKHDFYIISANGTELALNTENLIQINKKVVDEVIVKINEKVEVCFDDNSCATFSLK